MSKQDNQTIQKIYSKSLLNEMNLGANADTTSGGLGSPQQMVVPGGTHSPADYHEATPCCGRCGACSEDEEHYADEKGCCKTCSHCGGEVQEDSEAFSNVFHNKIKVSLHDYGDNLKRYNDYEVTHPTVAFEIEPEYRSWGLKGITVQATGKLGIDVEGIIWADEGPDHTEDHHIIVDANRIKCDFEKNSSSKYIGSLTITELDLYLLPNFAIDYDRSYFTVVC